ncbi:MAG TPA: hypothetical protein VGI42_02240 [Chthoniobacterales bacterium]|jgi:type II secretory pathway pseudopilin PulG
MKRDGFRNQVCAYTLAEVCVGLGLFSIVGGLAYTVLMSSTTLFAKNVSLNSSSTVLRSALDRIYSEINQSNGMPKLINADGSAPLNPAGPAAGIIFDRYVGGPYVVTNPGALGLPATAQSFEMKSSTNPLASPPIPVSNDVICLDNCTTRPVVNSCSASLSGSFQTLAVTLKAPLGKSISWSADTQQTAYAVHRKAFVVVPVAANGRGELRMYNDAETLPNFNNPASYIVLTGEIGGQVGENTPFSIVTQNGATFLNIAMRVEDQQLNKYLATQQSKEFNTFLRVDTMLRPRNFL